MKHTPSHHAPKCGCGGDALCWPQRKCPPDCLPVFTIHPRILPEEPSADLELGRDDLPQGEIVRLTTGVGLGRAQWLRALTALPEELGAIPSTHAAAHGHLQTVSNSSFRWSNSFFPPQV